MNVLVIPEDFRKDQYVLKPIVEKLMQANGVRAKVKVCQDPLLGGVGEALKWERIEEILERYRGMVRVFLLLVDRDCKSGRRAKLTNLEKKARKLLGDSDRVFLGENAWQEVEVWVLAGLSDLPKWWKWKDVRAECDPKERYYDVHAAKRGLGDAPYDGRDVLAREAAASFGRIRQLCPEVKRLQDELKEQLAS